jgi:hypothetical protein
MKYARGDIILADLPFPDRTGAHRSSIVRADGSWRKPFSSAKRVLELSDDDRAPSAAPADEPRSVRFLP